MKTTRCALAVVVVLAAAVSAAWAADPFPAAAKGFAGMVAGKVTSKGADQAVIEVTKIDRTWKHNAAENAEALVGKQVTLKIIPAIYERKKGYLPKVRHFFELLKVGDTDVFDCRQKEGDSLTFLELTKAQQVRVEEPAK